MSLFCQGCAILQKQTKTIFALSPAEAELVALLQSVKEALRFQKFRHSFSILGKIFDSVATEDNMACFELSEDMILSNCSKYIDINDQLMMNHVRKETIKISHIPNSNMDFDLFTKPLSKMKPKNLSNAWVWWHKVNTLRLRYRHYIAWHQRIPALHRQALTLTPWIRLIP